MTFDLDALLRKLKPQKSIGALASRVESRLRFVTDDTNDTPIMLDTCVYIDTLEDRLPAAVTRLIDRSTINHSSLAVAELAHRFGRLNPAHTRTAANLNLIRTVIEAIQPNRLFTPSAQALIQAAVTSGVAARRLGYPAGMQLQPMLNDAILFFQALETGSVLLTGNIKDLDLIQQLVSAGKERVLYYKQL